MQVTETLSQGLKREYNIFSAGERSRREAERQLAELKTKAAINGFRPGKVPVAHLRKVYGRSVMADVVQEAINAANKQIVDDNGLRLAREPKIELPTDRPRSRRRSRRAATSTSRSRSRCCRNSRSANSPISRSSGRSPMSRRPKSRPRSSGSPTSRRTYTDEARGRQGRDHDRVTVDFDGTIDGEPFEGGAGQGHRGRARLRTPSSPASRSSCSASSRARSA